MKCCYQIHTCDNVATMLEHASDEPVTVVGASAGQVIELKKRTMLGHKVALTMIEAGQGVIKYGVTIGIATRWILAGQRVHLHNCKSQVDEAFRDARCRNQLDNGYTV